MNQYISLSFIQSVNKMIPTHRLSHSHKFRAMIVKPMPPYTIFNIQTLIYHGLSNLINYLIIQHFSFVVCHSFIAVYNCRCEHRFNVCVALISWKMVCISIEIDSDIVHCWFVDLHLLYFRNENNHKNIEIKIIWFQLQIEKNTFLFISAKCFNRYLTNKKIVTLQLFDWFTWFRVNQNTCISIKWYAWMFELIHIECQFFYQTFSHAQSNECAKKWQYQAKKRKAPVKWSIVMCIIGMSLAVVQRAVRR